MITHIQRHGFKIVGFFAGIIILTGVYLISNLSTREVFAREPMMDQEEVLVTKPLLFVGDIMLGRYVEVLMNSHGASYPFGTTTEFLKHHTTIANLEGPIPNIHTLTKNHTMAFSFPARTPSVLQENGISAVSLANNHSLDKGVLGYEDTKRALDSVGIAHFGGYSTTLSEHFETHIGTTSVIVYGINMISSTWNAKTSYDTTELLRKQYPHSMLIAFIHWGNEYDTKQSEAQRVIARELVDRGVDVIVGSHPHVVQGVEVYKGVPIFYSLGNFIFDQYFSQEVEEGYVLAVDRQQGEMVYTLLPVVSNRSQISFAEGEKAEEILKTISRGSDSFAQKNVVKSELRLPWIIR